MSPPCFVPNCKSGTKGTIAKNKIAGKRNETLFRPPKDKKLLAMWAKRIPRGDRKLTAKDRVCILHFYEEDVLKFFETKMPDGTIHRIERERWGLRDGALPSIFPNCPAYLSYVKKKRKPPKIRDNLPKKPKKKAVTSAQNELPLDEEQVSINEVTSSQSDLSLNEEHVSIIEIELDNEDQPVSNTDPESDIELPPSWSRSQISASETAFMNWVDGMIHRHFIINESSKARFFVCNSEVTIKQFDKTLFNTNEALIQAIDVLSNIKICSSQSKNRVAKICCRGYVLYPDQNLCEPCSFNLENFENKTKYISHQRNQQINIKRKDARMKAKKARQRK